MAADDERRSMTLYVKDIPKILEAAYECRDEIVPCLIGPSGIGKTEAVYAFAESKGVNVVEEILSQRSPTEISGLVMPDSDNKSMEIFDHTRLTSMNDGDILFLDELLEAPPMVLSACLTLIQERRLMSGRMLPDIMIVAATNPTVSPSLMKLSQRQRFMFLDIGFDKEGWMNHVEEETGVHVSNRLSNMINVDGDEWNILTPRTCTKLIKMAQKCMENGNVDAFRMMCKSMFDDDYTSTTIIESIEYQPPKKTMINRMMDAIHYNSAIPSNLLTSLSENLEEMKVEDMLDYLREDPRWPEIEKALMSIDLTDLEVIDLDDERNKEFRKEEG